MYLSHDGILTVLNEMNFQTSNPEFPFDEKLQVKVCSIDLRISNEFWTQKTLSYPIDLDQSKLAELSPNRHWKKRVLKPSESITLYPNEFILGRTYEKFEVPIKYAGKINTRSSFARLGIETNSATDFINPGWKGYVPLEIINKSKNKIKLYPYSGLIQIFLIPLEPEPKSSYGEEKFKSKYQNDDGGPSKWWRDDMYKHFVKKQKKDNISEDVIINLIEKFDKVDDLGLYRFEKFIQKLKPHELDNAASITDKFLKKETRRSKWQSALYWIIPLFNTPSIGFSAKLLYDNTAIFPFAIFLYLFTLSWIVFSVYWLFFKTKQKYYSSL